MTAVAPPTPRKRRRRLGWTLLIGVPVLMLATVATTLLWYSWSDERNAAAAIAETEQLDPRWRWEEILADRPPIADADNSARQVAKVMTVHGKPSFDVPLAEFEQAQMLAPANPLNRAQLAALRAFVAKTPDALAEARKLADFPTGRPRIQYAKDFISTLLGPVQDARGVCSLLHCDALLQAEDGDFEAALRSCRAMLNAGRSIGDEPYLIALLVRASCINVTIDVLERVLGQGEVPEPALAEMQGALEQELAQPSLLIALRGERAGYFELQQLICQGKVAPSHFAAMTGKRLSAMERVFQDHLPGGMVADRATFLRQMNELVEAAKLPIGQQMAEFDRIRAVRPPSGLPQELQHPWAANMIVNYFRLQANLGSTVAALAAERYRLKHGSWPRSLDVLVQERLLKTVPCDPFDGRTLRCVQRPGGMVIYSVGPDRTDHGGVVQRIGEPQAGSDQGFRLLDTAERGR
jgi:hypothetical protein